MPSPFVPSPQQSTLPAGTAATWRFDRAVVLVVQRGRIWLTLERMPMEAGTDPAVPRGADWFLDAGALFRLPARQAVVLEASGRPGEAAVLSVHAEAVALLRPQAWLAALARRCRDGLHALQGLGATRCEKT
ncbi:DUF2917 domain-containing protein [Xylophilus rhododendri]|uniref:DUF2917 domain-containing protein n=1 Tax=Xylophilus rhododendri TaxID=2697032 RepID=A0A857JA44_9BURK|nr:DUF2917 domain-containing protein [Xylophilus rhododendri]QHI99615.1 DUF2917 domain-containing protein [Xylophilus rhododendri]